jgi:hypothetical protein
MSYLDELLAGYQEGLAARSTQPIQALRAALSEPHEPKERGVLLGLLARAVGFPLLSWRHRL